MISVTGEPAAAWPLQAAASKRPMRRLLAMFAAWRQRALSRTQLARLGERELRDIGVTPAEAAREYAKPFWRS
ncbi:MAG TPA: DUF1127 domain-containing protein [Stellaceae bacterium]|nr:DUF1127 domain-containing protein [Stellaceae bacterium]